MKRIFVDIGAYPSWTVDTALLPEFKVDIVYAIDPSPQHHPLLDEQYKNDSRVVIVKTGLWNKTCIAPFYNEGSIGGSVFRDFQTAKPNGIHTNCQFLKASEWFADNIPTNAFIVVKFNCEGSECDILDDLMDSGEYKKITIALVDFDVRKTPSQAHRQKEVTSRAKQLGFSAMKVWLGGRNQKRTTICKTLTFFSDQFRSDS